MIYVGIDIAKDKHDCCILGSDGEILFSPFTIRNSLRGFDELYEKIWSLTSDLTEIKVGLEATGHYHLNLLRSLLDNGLASFVINPLHTTLYRKGQSLRKTKTDKVDAASIAMMLLTDRTLKPYSDTSYHNEELKSLTRYRFDKVQERAKLKTSVSRLVSILFPELEPLVPTLHMTSVYALLSEFPGASFVAAAHLTRLKHLLHDASNGRYGRDMAISIREAASSSIGSVLPAKSLELKHTIRLIEVLSAEIDEIETAINAIMDVLDSPITTIPGIKNRMGAMILAEIGDFSRFDNPDQILAYAGLSPTTYQSGQMTSSYAHMEKRGSRYLRYALFNATKYVCMWDPIFKAYLAKKRAEGKHYYVAISHACKKLVRVIYSLQMSRESYRIS
ncbi:IS110 family RNA-guided transposase [Mogibacterium pumilum]|uniref:Transposase n=2 Tax=Mogibacterium pumilum TaxID=86332 RepID=A0A223ASQ5_9FIRM|nr:IS110 family transposase [Mogibacterium pumilum]ASS37836.1 transposase [Mogibacterium pumilum]ASS37943.1 transposase [Mogibacterium pumilum]ASS38003.1 transposase [Mogibacterium pumilum]ASS38042.1 transposase [Mogibacterium pumilum]